MIKLLARQMIPSLIRTWLNGLLGLNIHFEGPFENWHAAEQHASGYDSEHILQQVRRTTQRVVLGELAYEQDSVGFSTPSPPTHVLHALAEAAADASASHGLNVLDFGGALGSHFFRVRPYLEPLRIAHWSVCEQQHFVVCGKSEFERGPLRFYSDPNDALANGRIDLLILSSVLPYLPEPARMLGNLMALKPQWILIDRTPFSPDDRNYLLVQHTPRSIYKASYPIWLLAHASIHALLMNGYTPMQTFECEEVPVVSGSIIGKYRGMLWRLNTDAALAQEAGPTASTPT